MTPKVSPLYSEYVIDGLREDLTPAQMLGLPASDREWEPIVDETVDASPTGQLPPHPDIQESLDAVLCEQLKRFPVTYSGPYTAVAIGVELIETIFRTGHFRIGDLAVGLDWQWDQKVIGNLAAFYASAQEAATFADALGIAINNVKFTCAQECSLDVQVRLLRRDEDDEDLLVRMPDHSRHPVLLGSRHVAASLLPDPQSWIVFIPFDTCAFRLSGSLLSQAYGLSGAAAPDVGDADYFTDCFEVVREMVEDGVVIAGATVREGGMLTALRHMCQDCGAGVNIADIMKTYGESREERVLFAEVPGVLLQIRDIDYDYFDAEMLLQDVAYFPVGHPIPGGGLRVENFSRTGIQSILDSLLLSQGSEGED